MFGAHSVHDQGHSTGIEITGVAAESPYMVSLSDFCSWYAAAAGKNLPKQLLLLLTLKKGSQRHLSLMSHLRLSSLCDVQLFPISKQWDIEGISTSILPKSYVKK